MAKEGKESRVERRREKDREGEESKNGNRDRKKSRE